MRSIRRLQLLGSLLFAALLGPATAGTFTAVNDTEVTLIENKVRASQFLNMATFGPTMDDIDTLAARMSQIGSQPALEEWIDGQFALPITSHHALAKSILNDEGVSLIKAGAETTLVQAWWNNAVSAPDQLRQRVAWALAQIWVVGLFGNLKAIDTSGEPMWAGWANYYDTLLKNSFGNYRDLMEDITLHPVMGRYLSHVNNKKPDPTRNQFPDENFARELLQLFTMGHFKLQPDGTYERLNGTVVETYDNVLIQQFARVFTGLSWGTSSVFGRSNTYADYHTPMKMYDSMHDQGAKTLFSGRVLPANQGGMRDINDALDNVFEHANVGPFVSRLLIQRLVRSNPSNSYVSRVADAFNGTVGAGRGDMQAVIKAILLDSEALSGVTIAKSSPLTLSVTPSSTNEGRLKEPAIRLSGVVRAFKPQSTCTNGRFLMQTWYSYFNQRPYESPSVFNYYQPDYQPSGHLSDYVAPDGFRDGRIVAPEFQILPTAVHKFVNDISKFVNAEKITNITSLGGRQCATLLDFSAERALAASDLNTVMSRMDLLLCQGTLQDQTRTAIVTNAVDITRAMRDRVLANNIAMRGIITAAIISPECAVSH